MTTPSSMLAVYDNGKKKKKSLFQDILLSLLTVLLCHLNILVQDVEQGMYGKS